MVYKGLRFGMLLQLAIGPMCLMVFKTSAKYGFLMGLMLVMAIAVIDGLYITLSGLGVAVIINRRSIKSVIKVLGCIILVLFGINTITGVTNLSFLPNIAFFANVTNHNIFVQGLLLTASNPLTIIFWSGVFSTQVIENELNRKQLFLFGLGCILSTLLFLSFVAICGDIISMFLPQTVIDILNIMVGFILIFFGVKLLFKK